MLRGVKSPEIALVGHFISLSFSFDTIPALLYNRFMSIPQLLQYMCADLSEADLNAIRKARGFSSREIISRNSFASFFISSIGLQEVMQNLSAEEVVTLHLLQQTGEVNISFFERLYGSEGSSDHSYFYTFTQKYKPILDAVKKNLVRKGLLIMAETKTRGDSVQMERWRFAFPPEFAPYLPQPLQTSYHDQSGDTSDHLIRKKLLQLVSEKLPIPNDPVPIQIKNNSIWLGEQLFSAGSLYQWQMLSWQKVLKTFQPNVEGSLAPTDAILSLFKNLGPGEWASTKNLDSVFKVYCFGGKVPSADKILREGWELGLLFRLKIGPEFSYRLASPAFPADPDVSSPPPLSWLKPNAAVSETKKLADCNSYKVDMRLIPLDQLELLNKLVSLEVENGDLIASPSLVKLGQTAPAQWQSPLSHWLAENNPAFKKVFTAVNERWGKTLLHENLLIACVRNLSLRVQLERELGQNIIVLNEHFIAFPPKYRANVEKILKKSDFVIKTILS